MNFPFDTSLKITTNQHRRKWVKICSVYHVTNATSAVVPVLFAFSITLLYFAVSLFLSPSLFLCLTDSLSLSLFFFSRYQGGYVNPYPCVYSAEFSSETVLIIVLISQININILSIKRIDKEGDYVVNYTFVA